MMRFFGLLAPISSRKNHCQNWSKLLLEFARRNNTEHGSDSSRERERKYGHGIRHRQQISSANWVSVDLYPLPKTRTWNHCMFSATWISREKGSNTAATPSRDTGGASAGASREGEKLLVLVAAPLRRSSTLLWHLAAGQTQPLIWELHRRRLLGINNGTCLTPNFPSLSSEQWSLLMNIFK